MRASWCLPILTMTLAAGVALALPGRSASQEAKAKAKAAEPAPMVPEQEATARDFVRRHHPELDALLDKLKPMNPVEYAKVIGDLFRTSESLDSLRAKDPRRYEFALDAWKAKSRVERLAAEDSKARTPESESALRQALAAQIDGELAQRKFERDAAEARLQKMNEQIGRLEADRSSLIETRLRRLTKGRPVGKALKVEKSAPSKDSPERKANP